MHRKGAQLWGPGSWNSLGAELMEKWRKSSWAESSGREGVSELWRPHTFGESSGKRCESEGHMTDGIGDWGDM